MNEPNGQSTQHFICERKGDLAHIIGKSQKKRLELMATYEVNVQTFSQHDLRHEYYTQGSYTSRTNKTRQYGGLTISGKAHKVDEAMLGITSWVNRCRSYSSTTNDDWY